MNTSAQVRRDPLVGLVASLPGNIEASERRGQEEFTASEVLPSKINDPHRTPPGTGRKILEAWGFTFGKNVHNDTLLVQAKLPSGWTKKGSSHAMWSYVHDEQGRERCSIFYKAAFYDRDAFLSIAPRYLCDSERESQDEDKRYRCRVRGIVKEGNVVLYAGEWRAPAKKNDDAAFFAASDLAEKDAREWFEANLPTDLVGQWAAPATAPVETSSETP